MKSWVRIPVGDFSLCVSFSQRRVTGHTPFIPLSDRKLSRRNMFKGDVLHDAPTYEGGHASGARAPDTVAGVPTGQEAMEAGS